MKIWIINYLPEPSIDWKIPIAFITKGECDIGFEGRIASLLPNEESLPNIRAMHQINRVVSSINEGKISQYWVESGIGPNFQIDLKWIDIMFLKDIGDRKQVMEWIAKAYLPSKNA